MVPISKLVMQPLNIAIFHHHLNRGGVSRVVLNQFLALSEQIKNKKIKVAIFHGGREPIDQELQNLLSELNLESISIRNLEYDSLRTDFSADDKLAEVIEQNLSQRSFAKSNTVLHFHNHSLGKNRALIPAINSLAKSGNRVLLQVHDMAEDFRPKNYALLASELPGFNCSLANVLPLASQVHFGVINRRDETILKKTGIPASSIHYLPNSVTTNEIPDQENAKHEFGKRNSIDPKSPLLLYPVRGIRRKNIGEAFLLTLISRKPVCVGLTLPPTNPIEQESYQSWKELCVELRLPVLFELGNQEGISFADNVAAADAILTTSIVEGFGLVFLESFAFGKKLVGRDIPPITADFKQSGIQFEQLYSEIRIPIELINLADFDRQLKTGLNQTYASFGKSVERNEYDSYLNQIFERAWIDFARLPVCQQRDVIAAAARDPRVRTLIQEANSDVADWVSAPPSAEQNELIHRNRAIIAETYSGIRMGESLLSIYEQLVNEDIGEVTSNPNPTAILKHFLSIENFYPLQVASPNPPDEQNYFLPIIQDSLKWIAPIPTEVTPKLMPLSDIKAIVFDIYGTLLVSSSGDVGTDAAFSDQSNSADPWLDQILKKHGTDLSTALGLVKSRIDAEHQKLREAGIPFPEIEITSIWHSVLTDTALSCKGDNVAKGVFLGIPLDELKEISLRAELLTNPVWKMPGFDQCLREIQSQKIELGIISNAQFYTPYILEALAEKTLADIGFCNRLSHFSYRIGRAKPDQFLYKLAATSLEQFHITPKQTLYVGNDVTKDMIPAHQTGFRTGLFAGDKRSLRCGDHGNPQHHHAIDLVFTDLKQITTVLR